MYYICGTFPSVLQIKEHKLHCINARVTPIAILHGI